MKTFKLYCCDDIVKGVLDYSQRKELGYTVREVHDVSEAFTGMIPVIAQYLHSYDIVRNLLAHKVKTKCIYEPLVTAFSGTDTWFANCDIVEEHSGLVLKAHFQLVEVKDFPDVKGD